MSRKSISSHNMIIKLSGCSFQSIKNYVGHEINICFGPVNKFYFSMVLVLRSNILYVVMKGTSTVDYFMTLQQYCTSLLYRERERVECLPLATSLRGPSRPSRSSKTIPSSGLVISMNTCTI